jgi:signal transduction histidine kinase
VRWKQGNREARYYTLAWGGFFVGIFFFNLTVLGVVPVNTATLNAPQIGSAIEVILLSFALARKFKTLTDEKMKIKTDAADSLQQKVEERTLDLNQALQDLKISETRLATQARLTGIGHLVTGVVHEVGNPLNYLRGSLELIREDIEKPPEVTTSTKDLLKSVGMAERATERISEVIENLRTFLTKGELDRTMVKLDHSIQSTLDFVKQDMVNQNIEPVLDIKPCPPIEANDGIVRQIILNLVINAMQAMKNGGKLHIQLEPQDKEIRLTIRDTGPGIPPEIRDSIFDPFFTTKPPGKSMGLGLSITHKMVTAHRGTIELAKTTQGAEFVVRFPIENSV